MRKVRRIQRRAHKSPRKVPLVRQREAPQRRRASHGIVLGKRKLFAADAEAEAKVHKRVPVPVPEQKIVVPRDEKPPETTPDTETENDQEQEPNTEEIQAVAETEQPVDTAAEVVKQEQLPRERTNAYSLYLREIGQTKLLTPQEEIKLAARIKRGDSRAREEMIKANLRLVVKIAREYEDYGVPLLDLINEGNIGLMKAVERFDPAKGAKLSTYAAWWIKQAIRRALSNQSKTIRLPVHVGDKLVHMRRAAVRLHEELGREPTDEELAKALETTATRINELRNAGARPSSLDAPIGGDDDSNPFGDIIGDEKADTPYEQLEDKANTALVRELVDKLPEREATILRYRFGLDGDDERTLEEVGAKFGVTRERIRQLQNIALTKLKKMIQKRESVKMAA